MCADVLFCTSAVDETAIVAHGTEVFKDEHGDGTNQQQHDKHHDPDVCTERLCGWRTDTFTDTDTGEEETNGGESLTKECRWRHGAIAPRHHDTDARLYEGHGEVNDL